MIPQEASAQHRERPSGLSSSPEEEASTKGGNLESDGFIPCCRLVPVPREGMIAAARALARGQRGSDDSFESFRRLKNLPLPVATWSKSGACRAAYGAAPPATETACLDGGMHVQRRFPPPGCSLPGVTASVRRSLSKYTVRTGLRGRPIRKLQMPHRFGERTRRLTATDGILHRPLPRARSSLSAEGGADPSRSFLI